jgi:hypothetical protein
MCILLLHHKCHLSSANTNGQRSITMISNCELSCHWVGYPKVRNMCLCVSSTSLQGRDSRMWPVSGLQGYQEKDPITWPLSALQGLSTPKRRFAWSSWQDRPNQLTMPPKRESYDSGVVFVWSKIALHMAGGLNSRIGAAQWLWWTWTHFKNPVQLLASCCSLWLVADNRRLWTFDSFLWLLSNWQRTQNGSQVPAKISLINSHVLYEVNAADKAMSAITSVTHHFENQ